MSIQNGHEFKFQTPYVHFQNGNTLGKYESRLTASSKSAILRVDAHITVCFDLNNKFLFARGYIAAAGAETEALLLYLEQTTLLIPHIRRLYPASALNSPQYF